MKKILKAFLLPSLLLTLGMFYSCGETTSQGGLTPTDYNEIDVYFIAGQSNAAGSSDFYRSDLKTLNLNEENSQKAPMYLEGFENIYYYGAAYDISKSVCNRYDKLTNVKACMGVIKTREFGAELGMAEVLNDYYSGDKKAVIIKYGVNASGLLSNTGAFGEWSAPSYKNPRLGNDANLYSNMIGVEKDNYQSGLLYNAFCEMYLNGFNKINIKGFYWSQGESDESNINYGKALTALIGDFRNDINLVGDIFEEDMGDVVVEDNPNFPFLISEIAPTQAGAKKNADGTSSRATLNQIISLQRQVAEEMDQVYTLNTSEFDIVDQYSMWNSTLNPGVSYCNDQWHYNGDDMLTIGNQVGELLYNA